MTLGAAGWIGSTPLDGPSRPAARRTDGGQGPLEFRFADSDTPGIVYSTAGSDVQLSPGEAPPPGPGRPTSPGATRPACSAAMHGSITRVGITLPAAYGHALGQGDPTLVTLLHD